MTFHLNGPQTLSLPSGRFLVGHSNDQHSVAPVRSKSDPVLLTLYPAPLGCPQGHPKSPHGTSHQATFKLLSAGTVSQTFLAVANLDS